MRVTLKPVADQMSQWMEVVAGIALIGVMLLIGLDITGRFFGYPIPGAYELVSLAGGIIIGLAVPATSRAKGHLSVDLVLGMLPKRAQGFLIITTRLIGIAVFLLVGCSMISMGIRLKYSGEVTAVLALPFYPVVYLMGGAFLIQALVLFSEITDSESRLEARDE